MSSPHPLGEIALADCRVPAANRLGAQGRGFALGLKTLDRLRPTVGAAACGMAARALAEALAHARERRQFGKPIAEFQLVQEKLARMATELTAARLLVYRAAYEADMGAARITLEAAMAKAFATEVAQRVIDDAVQVLGGAGVLASHPVDRLYRSVRALRIYEGTTEIQHLVIAGQLLGERGRVKIACIGGGPAGLFFALLMKHEDPAHDVVVYERNRPEDTFGFGVVFSDATEEALADADPGTIAAMGAMCHRWDDIEIHYKGQTLTSTGHGFSGVSRRRLLEHARRPLPRRGRRSCASSTRWGTRPALRADLVFAADGLNSAVRERYREHFRPTIDVRPNRFVWLGTTRPFPAFTFYFKPTPHGLWRVHAYQYEPDRSTFIVEATRGDLARRRPRVRASEEPTTLAFCEKPVRRGARRPPPGVEPLDLAAASPRCATRAGRTGTSCWPGTPCTPRTSRSARGRSSRWRTRSRWSAALRDEADDAGGARRLRAGRRAPVESLQRAAQAEPPVVRGHRALHGPRAAASSRSRCSRGACA